MKKINAYALLICSFLSMQSLGLVHAQSIKGAGSSAAAPIYQSWAAEYQRAGNGNVAYESIGSSAGLKKIRESGTDFGASDVAPSEAELTKSGLAVFPIAITGVAPVVNLPSLADRPLRLNGAVLAQIFLGEITVWSDPQIKQLNPGLKLPDLKIKVIVRSDGSGTTYNFADYLAKVSPDWSSRFGVKTSFTWPNTFIGAKGSDGVVQAMKATLGAIGYVDFGYVQANGLKSVQLQNAQGHFLSPSNYGFREALMRSDWSVKGSFVGSLTQQAGEGTWPITMGTYALFPKKTDHPIATARALEFFVWAFMNGDRLVQQNNFVRLPDRIQTQVYKIISSIKDKNGVALNVKMVSYTVAQK
jgi:phosphate transport system substrate-binding protein